MWRRMRDIKGVGEVIERLHLITMSKYGRKDYD